MKCGHTTNENLLEYSRTSSTASCGVIKLFVMAKYAIHESKEYLYVYLKKTRQLGIKKLSIEILECNGTYDNFLIRQYTEYRLSPARQLNVWYGQVQCWWACLCCVDRQVSAMDSGTVEPDFECD